MRGVAKTINAEASRVACFAIGTIPDQPGAKQRRSFDIIVAIGQVKTESGIGRGEFGVTAVDVVTSETRVVAQILPVRSAVSTFAIRPADPGNAYAISDVEFRIRSFADLFYAPNKLMAGNQRQLWIRQFGIDNVEIGAAYRPRCDSHKQLSLGRPRFVCVAG